MGNLVIHSVKIQIKKFISDQVFTLIKAFRPLLEFKNENLCIFQAIKSKIDGKFSVRSD